MSDQTRPSLESNDRDCGCRPYGELLTPLNDGLVYFNTSTPCEEQEDCRSDFKQYGIDVRREAVRYS